MKLIELLNKVNEEIEVPRRIKYRNMIFEYNGNSFYGITDDCFGDSIAQYIADDLSNLDAEIEILVDSKDIIEVDEQGYIHTRFGSWKGRKLDIALAEEVNKLTNRVQRLEENQNERN